MSALNRALSATEMALLRWLVSQSSARAQLLPQLDGIRVVDECGCGCGSYYLRPDRSRSAPSTVMESVSIKYDVLDEQHFCLGELMLHKGWISGVELVAMGGAGDACRLPGVDDICEVQVVKLAEMREGFWRTVKTSNRGPFRPVGQRRR